MTYESLHDDDDFRVNWCRNMDSFLFICAQDDHAAPHLSFCSSRAARRQRGVLRHRVVRRQQAVGRHLAVRRHRAMRRQQAVAATGLHAATGLTASTLQPGCPLTPATGLHADARHRDGRNRPAPYYIVDLVDMVSHSANQQAIEVASHMHT